MTDAECHTVTLKSGRILKYLSQKEVDFRLAASAGDASVESQRVTDIESRVYEGGFKVWECSKDLSEFIEGNAEIVSGKNVLELGCGAALPAITALSVGASSALLQDFNESVLLHFTRDCVLVNGVSSPVSYVSGSWASLLRTLPPSSVDVVLSSETIYNEDYYESLHDLMYSVLREGGIAWIAAKAFYFGLSGCVPTFVEYVKSRKQFAVEEKTVISAAVPRVIIQLSK